MVRGTKSRWPRRMLGSLGHRVHSAAVDFASWAPSTGVLLLLMSIVAIVVVNSPLGAEFSAFWEAPLGFEFADARFRMSLAALGQRWPPHDLLPAGGARDQARVHGRAARASALGGVSRGGRDRRHGGAGSALLARGSGGRMEPRLGRADGHRHRVRGRADRDARQARAGRAARVPHRRVDRRRHRRDHRRRAVLLGRAALGRTSRAPRRSPCCWRCSTDGASTARCRTPSWASHCGRASTRADCTSTLAGVVLALFIPTRPPPNLEGADGAGDRRVDRGNRARARTCCAMAPRRRRCARSTRSTTASNRRPTARCARSSRGRAISCCRCSRSQRGRRAVDRHVRGPGDAGRRDRARARRRQARRAS